MYGCNYISVHTVFPPHIFSLLERDWGPWCCGEAGGTCEILGLLAPSASLPCYLSSLDTGRGIQTGYVALGLSTKGTGAKLFSLVLPGWAQGLERSEWILEVNNWLYS